MTRGFLLPVALFVGLAGERPGRAADAPLTTSVSPAPAPAQRRFALSLAGGSDAAPQGHLGLRFAFSSGRLEASAGLGLFIGADPRTEDAAGKSPTELTHVVPSLGVHYVALHRKWFDLVPGLGLSLRPVHFEEATTRPSYDTVQWSWESKAGLSLDADLEARFQLGDSWFTSVVVGWGLFIYYGPGGCHGNTTQFGFSCQQPPSPAYSPPTPLANAPYAQLVAGRRF
jgi:hypothetical protein